MSKKINDDYNEESITQLDYPINIQKKPTMYIGDIRTIGCTHLVREVLDNSVDECLNGYGNCITINISNKNGSCSVEDEGRGIPPKAIEKAFCNLHASGKFNNKEYSASAGTNGVGTTAVNALSKSFIVESVREHTAYVQKFSDGLAITKLTKTGTKKKESGTIVYFEPNKKFMKEVNFDIDVLKDELSSKVYVLKGIKLVLNNEDTKEKFEYLSKNGLSDYIKACNKEPISSSIKLNKNIPFKYIDEDDNEIDLTYNVDMEFSYDKKSHTDIISFCNSLCMKDGGIQEVAFRTTLTKFFKKYIKENNLLTKKDEKLLDKISGEHVCDGLVAIISIKHPMPEFQNQTKQQLRNAELNKISTYVNEALEEFAAENPKEVKNICNKIILSVKAFEAAKNARESVQKKGENQFSIVSDLSKLANCISKDISVNEIFITEGRSASGTAKDARDKYTQAIYGLRGKMLNTINTEAPAVLANKECADLAYILTGQKNAIDDKFDISLLKYGKIIMLCDADFDGLHIVILGTTYIFEHMKPIIEEGHFYVAIPPLYSIIEKGKKRYFVDQEEYDNYIYKKILESYSFVDENEKSLNKKIKVIFNKYDMLSSHINLYSLTNIGLSKQFLLDLLDYCVDEGDIDEKTIKTFIKDCDNIKFNKDKKIYNGFYGDDYVSFEFDKLIKFTEETVEYIENNKIPIGDIYYGDKNSNEYSAFTISEYIELIYNVTPKSRTRLKGLGEMDADELKETTLDVEKRNLYRVTIEDVERAKEAMNNFMDSNSKYVAFRKAILLNSKRVED